MFSMNWKLIMQILLDGLMQIIGVVPIPTYYSTEKSLKPSCSLMSLLPT